MKLSRLLFTATVALAVAAPASAAMPYAFQTGGNAYGNASPVLGAFAPTDTVQGFFLLNYRGAPTLTLGDGSTQYGGNITLLTGFTKGLGFADLSATTRVGNDLAAGDFLQLRADPPVGTASAQPRNLAGFGLAGYQLVDVRLFWMAGMPGVGDFLADASVPKPLPTLTGRLALDFVEGGDLTQPVTSVFFDGLQVTAVPEPRTWAMYACGLAGLGVWVRRGGKARARR
jgi:hypothetical protein